MRDGMSLLKFLGGAAAVGGIALALAFANRSYRANDRPDPETMAAIKAANAAAAPCIANPDSACVEAWLARVRPLAIRLDLADSQRMLGPLARAEQRLRRGEWAAAEALLVAMGPTLADPIRREKADTIITWPDDETDPNRYHVVARTDQQRQILLHLARLKQRPGIRPIALNGMLTASLFLSLPVARDLGADELADDIIRIMSARAARRAFKVPAWGRAVAADRAAVAVRLARAGAGAAALAMIDGIDDETFGRRWFGRNPRPLLATTDAAAFLAALDRAFAARVTQARTDGDSYELREIHATLIRRMLRMAAWRRAVGDDAAADRLQDWPVDLLRSWLQRLGAPSGARVGQAASNGYDMFERMDVLRTHAADVLAALWRDGRRQPALELLALWNAADRETAPLSRWRDRPDIGLVRWLLVTGRAGEAWDALTASGLIDRSPPKAGLGRMLSIGSGSGRADLQPREVAGLKIAAALNAAPLTPGDLDRLEAAVAPLVGDGDAPALPALLALLAARSGDAVRADRWLARSPRPPAGLPAAFDPTAAGGLTADLIAPAAASTEWALGRRDAALERLAGARRTDESVHGSLAVTAAATGTLDRLEAVAVRIKPTDRNGAGALEYWVIREYFRTRPDLAASRLAVLPEAGANEEFGRDSMLAPRGLQGFNPRPTAEAGLFAAAALGGGQSDRLIAGRLMAGCRARYMQTESMDFMVSAGLDLAIRMRAQERDGAARARAIVETLRRMQSDCALATDEDDGLDGDQWLARAAGLAETLRLPPAKPSGHSRDTYGLDPERYAALRAETRAAVALIAAGTGDDVTAARALAALPYPPAFKTALDVAKIQLSSPDPVRRARGLDGLARAKAGQAMAPPVSDPDTRFALQQAEGAAASPGARIALEIVPDEGLPDIMLLDRRIGGDRGAVSPALDAAIVAAWQGLFIPGRADSTRRTRFETHSREFKRPEIARAWFNVLTATGHRDLWDSAVAGVLVRSASLLETPDYLADPIAAIEAASVMLLTAELPPAR